MSLYDYRAAQEIVKTDPPFYALIMAAMRKADTFNLAKLRAAFPDTYAEVEARYNAPGAMLPSDGTDFDDDDDDQCEGHESLDGAHMGESVYCDGSCRRAARRRSERVAR